MKERWKNNLGLKIMAVLFAVFLWWTVVNIDDPVQTKNYQVEVLVKNPQVVTEAGKSYQIDENLKTIKVTVKARRKVLGEIKASNITATADLLEMESVSGIVPIRVEIKGFEYVEATASPRNIQIITEDTQKKTFPIQVTTMGSVLDGYILDKENTVASPQVIDISGPKSSLLRIARVVAKVDVSELSQDFQLKAELIYYDSADNIIDKSLLSSNCDKNGVMVDVKLLKTKEVELRFDTSQIEPAKGYVFKGLEIEPQKITIAGTVDKLSAVSSITVGGEALKRSNISSNDNETINIEEYLPEGIQLADEDAGTVAVRILIEEAGTKTILLPVRSIKVNGTPEGFDVTYGPEQEVELKFSAPTEILEILTSEKIIAMIDLTEFKEEGTYDVPVQIIDAPEQCEYVGSATVQITFTKQEINSEEVR